MTDDTCMSDLFINLYHCHKRKWEDKDKSMQINQHYWNYNSTHTVCLCQEHNTQIEMSITPG